MLQSRRVGFAINGHDLSHPRQTDHWRDRDDPSVDGFAIRRGARNVLYDGASGP